MRVCTYQPMAAPQLLDDGDDAPPKLTARGSGGSSRCVFSRGGLTERERRDERRLRLSGFDVRS